MEYVGLNAARGRESHGGAAYRSLGVAAHLYRLRNKVAGGARMLADDDALGTNITFYLAVNLNLSLGLKIACNPEIRADD